MYEEIISGEIKPHQGKSREAALNLQNLGFRILHYGIYISVDAPEEVWQRVFKISFVQAKKVTKHKPGHFPTQTTYLMPENVLVPKHSITLLFPLQFHSVLF